MANIDLNSFLSAARNGDISTLRNCINNGIDIHLCNDLALRYAKENAQTEAVIFLLENGANIYAIDDLELRLASSMGETEKVMQLLQKGTCSEDAIIYATYNGILYGYEEIVKLLKNYISPLANDGAILKVLKLCRYENIISLFEEYFI